MLVHNIVNSYEWQLRKQENADPNENTNICNLQMKTRFEKAKADATNARKEVTRLQKVLSKMTSESVTVDQTLHSDLSTIMNDNTKECFHQDLIGGCFGKSNLKLQICQIVER